MDWAHDYFEHGYAQRWSLGPDMRWLPVRSGSVHAATLFDAFGFFEHEEQTQAVSTEAGRGHRRHLAAMVVIAEHRRNSAYSSA